MTRSDLIAQILTGIQPRWVDIADAVACAVRVADEAIKRGAVTVTDAPNPGASDIDAAIEHLRKARAAFVLAGRERNAKTMLELIGTVYATRLEIGSE